ncbi:MAG: F0F1 ATP synthase subunit A [Candidatus Izimaplasma sp.]|nr:F0F1 ATP synthase subunit A [Candidatus Izimaplasma bacterium]
MIDYYVELSAGIKASLVITAFLMLSTFIIGLKVRKMKASDVPTGITLIAIMFVEGINDMQRDFFKKYWKQFTPYTLTILLFLMFANTASLAGLSAPLSNISVALGFSLLAFGSVQVAALFTKKPKQRAKDLLDPHWAFLPINLVGEMSTPFAMGLRLFGNLLSGAIIGIILYGILSWFGIIVGAFLIHPVFDMFFGLVQAYVYFMLLTIFLSMAVED